jgi:hypothetical protein
MAAKGPQCILVDFFDEIEKRLVDTYDDLKKDTTVYEEKQTLDELSLSLPQLRERNCYKSLLEGVRSALEVFMILDPNDGMWKRNAKCNCDWEDVTWVINWITGAIPLVPARHEESDKRLREIMAVAQRRYKIIDKRIAVWIRERTWRVHQGPWGRHQYFIKHYQPVTHTINFDHSVKQAVKSMYPAFPGACQKVVLRRGNRTLWQKTPQGDGSFHEAEYEDITAGDEITIELEIHNAQGPCQWSDFKRPVPGGGAIEQMPDPHEFDDEPPEREEGWLDLPDVHKEAEHVGEGPLGAKLVSDLLRQLAVV